MSKYAVTIDGRAYELEFDLPLQRGQTFQIRLGDEVVSARLPSDDLDWVIVNDRPYEIYSDGNPHILQSRSSLHTVEVRDRDTSQTRLPSADGRIKAPIPGMIARVLVAPGQVVEMGQPVLILEAMKMENEIRAPRDGSVAAVHVDTGRIVPRGELLAEIT